MDVIRIAMVTVPRDEAAALAKSIIESRLAACVNVLPKVESYYWWNDEINTDKESLLIIKTIENKIEKLILFVEEHHPNNVPEIIAFKLSEGLPEYINWVIAESGKMPSGVE